MYIQHIDSICYDKNVIDWISSRCSKNILAVLGYPVIVPNDKIQDVFRQIRNNNYSSPGSKSESDIAILTIDVITNEVISTLQSEVCSVQLDKFDTVLGDFNRYGLSSHSNIKLNNRHHNRSAGFMRY